MPKTYPLTSLEKTDLILVRRPGDDKFYYVTSKNLNDDALDEIRIVPTLTIGDEAANKITVAIQLAHQSDDADLDEQKGILAYLASDEDGEVLTATAPDGGWAAGDSGAIVNMVSNKMGLLITDSSGLVEIEITESSEKTFYLVLMMPSGILYGPVEIAFGSATA